MHFWSKFQAIAPGPERRVWTSNGKVITGLLVIIGQMKGGRDFLKNQLSTASLINFSHPS